MIFRLILAKIAKSPLMIDTPTVFVCLPVMQERAYLNHFLQCLKSQTYTKHRLIACVNHPEAFRNQSDKLSICEENDWAIEFLKKEIPTIILINKASIGLGWDNRHFGVGWARKLCMDTASEIAQNPDIVLSVDADTEYPADYIEKIVNGFNNFPDADAIAIPYFHHLTGKEAEDRAILRYEIYMRHYAINMLRIRQHYAFTAIGSAMACKVKMYRKIKGITPHKSGEDFYFLQKIRKSGSILNWVNTSANPAARFSDRVFFGTGPAMIKGANGQWDSYPIYHHSFFDEIEKTTNCYTELFSENVSCPMDDFLMSVNNGQHFREVLRKSCNNPTRFVKACHEFIDGLKILQYLRYRHQQSNADDEHNLQLFFDNYYDYNMEVKGFTGNFYPIHELDKIRNTLFEIETSLRKQMPLLK